MRRPPRNLWVRTALAGILASGLVYVHAGPAFTRRLPEATVLDLKDIILDSFVREVEPKQLEYAAIRGMIQALGDRHSSFMDPEDARAFYDQTDSEFSGLGMEITVRDGRVVVITPLEDTPAWRAGLLPGDVIIEIDGEPVRFESADEAARRLKGAPGTFVRLTVLHRGATTTDGHEVVIERALIKVRSVRQPEVEDAEHGIGYVRITHFSPDTARELREAVLALEERGARALVIDLRNNPGGYLQAALDTSDLFIAEGILLETRGRGEPRSYYARPETTLSPRPIAVLINGASASAAEIVAGALQDAGVARLFGTRSYGKGSVQRVTRLADGSALRLTTDYFHTRSGRRIHRVEEAGPEEEWGIHPDVEVELGPLALRRLLYRRAERAYESRNGHANGDAHPGAEPPPDDELSPVPNGIPPEQRDDLVDTQLEAALEWLRTQT